MPIEKQKIILISGILLGVVAVFMVMMYLDQQKQAAQEQAKKAIASAQSNQTVVLVAKEDIPKGSAIDSAALDTAVVPNRFVQPQAVTSLGRIAGMVTVAEITKGEQITLSKLVNAKQSSGDLAGITPAGKRAVSIAVDSLATLAGMVKPGDYVDVIAMLQVPAQNAEGQPVSQIAVVPLFQNVLVLAVGQNTGVVSRQSSKPETVDTGSGGATLVTLALTPQEASFAAFVQEQGKIRMTLRSPADAKVESIMPANLNTLFQYIMPQQQAQSVSEETTKEEPVETIEIYRGMNKEKIPISK